jgi:hypothetical protein
MVSGFETGAAVVNGSGFLQTASSELRAAAGEYAALGRTEGRVLKKDGEEWRVALGRKN